MRQFYISIIFIFFGLNLYGEVDILKIASGFKFKHKWVKQKSDKTECSFKSSYKPSLQLHNEG